MAPGWNPRKQVDGAAWLGRGSHGRERLPGGYRETIAWSAIALEKL
jgi:hypothetical protein